ncbi:MAG TPA: CopD family protein [Candidatus Methanoperedens sp.]|nr:CopD family protein [Candidatus Methanoperedens sp.]
MSGKRAVFLFAAGVLTLLALADTAAATPEFAAKTEQGCLTCHRDAEGGGALTMTGLRYAAAGYRWPPTGGYRVLGGLRRGVRLLVGYLHIVAAFLWFGTILYVHLMLRPAYASKGLPRGEVLLGLVSMAVVGSTGALLTASRVAGLDVLLDSPWGRVLLAKIALYLVMVSSAATAVVFVGPRLKRTQGKAVVPPDGIYDPATLGAFDGGDGRPARVAVGDAVYDVSSLSRWRGGAHMKHLAGRDLTAELGRAPHDASLLERAQRVGVYDPSRQPRKTTVQKAFYVVAYVNLALVFGVLFLLAWWRWGL